MSYPFHINPETNRANKCYNVDRCRFGLEKADHYTTAAEALAVRDARHAAAEADKATALFYQAHDSRVNEIANRKTEVETEMGKHLKKVVNRLKLEVPEKASSREIIKLAEASEMTDSIRKNLDSAKDELKTAGVINRQIKQADADYTGWTRFYEASDGKIHSSTKHLAQNRAWNARNHNGWLTELSGKTEEEVVEQHGAVLCDTCFTDVATEWTVHDDKAVKAENDRVLCEGSGTTDYDTASAHSGKGKNNNAICDQCGNRVTVNQTGNMRRHSIEVAAEIAQNEEVKEVANA